LKKSPRFKDNVFLMGPYRPGRIPLVLVHGTASSPARWAQLINEIVNDRELWNRYQIWMYTYNTGNPVLYSAGILAKGLRSVVRELDPEGKDPALRKMVVVGHSQGGMLTKMTAVDSGSRFWDSSFTVPQPLL
jgi:pimeloyl-ACP methyl ester carboxylesterase